MRLGEYDVSTTAEPLRHEEFNITDIVVYPGFNNSTLVHDIALLRLERPAKRKQNIDVVCMPKPDDFRQPTTTRSSVKCYVTGWGRRTESKSHFLQSQIRDVGIVFLFFSVSILDYTITLFCLLNYSFGTLIGAERNQGTFVEP